MFTQPCFIRQNTKELRDKLKALGLRENTLDDFSDKWLASNYGLFISVSEWYGNHNPKDIDCGTNERLFLAVAALRDDTDKNQFFVLDEDIPNHKKGTFILNIRDSWYVEGEREYRLNNRNALGHKATVKELIEHFKEK